MLDILTNLKYYFPYKMAQEFLYPVIRSRDMCLNNRSESH